MPQSGCITGALKEKGTHIVTVRARNERGSAERALKIVCGDTIALTPPMGWNSWNCFGCDVNEANVRAAADAMVASGLINHGWTYINIDDCWEAGRDADGNVLSNQKFPDMKALTDYVHSKGLKIGLYSSPGPKTCAGHEGSYKHEEQDARRYARVGIRLPEIRLVQLWRDRSQPRPRGPAETLPDHARRAGQDLARHRVQPLPVRHG